MSNPNETPISTLKAPTVVVVLEGGRLSSVMTNIEGLWVILIDLDNGVVERIDWGVSTELVEDIKRAAVLAAYGGEL